MSVATEFVPLVVIPDRARTSGVPQRLATVTTLHRPSGRSAAAPVRLTRRGVLVLAVAVALLGVGLLAVARLSAPSGAAPSAPAARVVTVHSGDTLWSIASRVAPDRDPRAEVAHLQQVNHLDGVALVPGQVLLTR